MGQNLLKTAFPRHARIMQISIQTLPLHGGQGGGTGILPSPPQGSANTQGTGRHIHPSVFPQRVWLFPHPCPQDFLRRLGEVRSHVKLTKCPGDQCPMPRGPNPALCALVTLGSA